MKYLISLLLLCFFTGAFGQSAKVIKEQAKAYIAAEHYEDAVNVLNSNRQLARKDEEGRFLMAVCYYQLNDLTAAKKLIEALIEEEKSPYPECWFYLGKIFHAQEQFPEAIQYYKTYLRLLRPDHPNRAMLIQEIKRCDNGLRLRFREAQTVVENMGPQVNSKGDEFGPVLSPNRSTKLYFSAIKQGNTGGARNQDARPDEIYGQHLSDMFSTQLSGGQWQAPQSLHYLLNTPQNEQVIGFSNYGSVLLYYKGWAWENGEIFADTFQQEAQRSLKTTPFVGPAQGERGEQNLFIYNDTLLVFSSQRAGGYGGFDLWMSSLNNKRWSVPKNLGPTINSNFDETSPFLSRDGSTLYFSTNDSEKSVGGLDVVRSVYIPEAGRWSEPENLGFPVNSPADDTHFILANDGFTAFFSSARKDALGFRDLYIAYFTKYRKEMELPETIAFQPQAVSSIPVRQPERPTQSPIVKPTPSPTTKIEPTSPALNVAGKSQWHTSSSSLWALKTNAWLDEVVNVAKRNQQDHIVLSCYLPNVVGEEKTKTFFDGIQVLKNIHQQLRQAGIPSSRVFLRALSSDTRQYQLTASVAPRQKNFDTNMNVIGESGGTTMPVSPINQTLVYKVQVLSVQRTYSNQKLSNQMSLMLENNPELPHLRYTVGAVSSFYQANELRQNLVNSGYKGAYVIPYLHGERIDKDYARRLVDEFPDLHHYLGR